MCNLGLLRQISCQNSLSMAGMSETHRRRPHPESGRPNLVGGQSSCCDFQAWQHVPPQAVGSRALAHGTSSTWTRLRGGQRPQLHNKPSAAPSAKATLSFLTACKSDLQVRTPCCSRHSGAARSCERRSPGDTRACPNNQMTHAGDGGGSNPEPADEPCEERGRLSRFLWGFQGKSVRGSNANNINASLRESANRPR